MVGVYAYTQFNNSSSNYKPLYETNKAGTQNTSQPVKGHMENVTKPVSEFRGPTFTGEVSGLKIIITLSNSSVRVGETLWIRVKLIGKDAHNIELLKMSIMNSKGQKVYDAYVWLPHRALAPGAKAPQEETYNIAWKASKHPSANVEITPGNYTFIIKATVSGKEAVVRGVITVVG